VRLAPPILQTGRLLLRPLAEADADDLFALHTDGDVLRFWDSPPWSERARAERLIAASRQIANDGTGVRLAIEAVSDARFIGWCSLSGWNPDFRSATLTYILDNTAWGHGYATEAARALLSWAFDAMNLNRIQAETDTRNAASARLLHKLGFELEGTLRQDCIVNGEVSDSFVFGLIKQDWAPSPDGM
jgi:RimJ/RimL family protein N-acetyltransferase